MATSPRKVNEPAARTDATDSALAIRLPKQDPCCEGPCDPPWQDDEQCSIWYETRYLRVPIGKDRPAERVASFREYIEFRITYEHRLCRVGKQLGPLLYTVTLLPGEKVNLYHSERYAQITTVQERFSVETTFTQFLSQIHQARLTSELHVLGAKLADIRVGSAASEGLGSVLDLSGQARPTTADHTSLNLDLVSEEFNQSVIEASRMTHAERSVVISTYAETEIQNVTMRTLQNDNARRALA